MNCKEIRLRAKQKKGIFAFYGSKYSYPQEHLLQLCMTLAILNKSNIKNKHKTKNHE